jgi:hypothetical protein
MLQGKAEQSGKGKIIESYGGPKPPVYALNFRRQERARTQAERVLVLPRADFRAPAN